MPEALVLVGRGRYQDPWHDDAATAQEVVRILAEQGVVARVRGTFPDTLEDVRDAVPALVVVIAGRGRPDAVFDGSDATWQPFHEQLTGLVDAGVPLLALHQAANTFADSPHWSGLLGGRWVVGTSMHPPIGRARFRTARADHPVTAGLGDVVTVDERYCHLEVAPQSDVLLLARHAGREHPVVWTRETGRRRVLYDALGHDVRSYASPSRRELVRREIAWLLSGATRAHFGT